MRRRSWMWLALAACGDSEAGYRPPPPPLADAELLLTLTCEACESAPVHVFAKVDDRVSLWFPGDEEQGPVELAPDALDASIGRGLLTRLETAWGRDRHLFFQQLALTLVRDRANATLSGAVRGEEGTRTCSCPECNASQFTWRDVTWTVTSTPAPPPSARAVVPAPFSPAAVTADPFWEIVSAERIGDPPAPLASSDALVVWPGERAPVRITLRNPLGREAIVDTELAAESLPTEAWDGGFEDPSLAGFVSRHMRVIDRIDGLPGGGARVALAVRELESAAPPFLVFRAELPEGARSLRFTAVALFRPDEEWPERTRPDSVRVRVAWPEGTTDARLPFGEGAALPAPIELLYEPNTHASTLDAVVDVSAAAGRTALIRLDFEEVGWVCSWPAGVWLGAVVLDDLRID